MTETTNDYVEELEAELQRLSVNTLEGDEAALAVWAANKSAAAHVLPIFLLKPGGSYWKQTSAPMDSF